MYSKIVKIGGVFATLFALAACQNMADSIHNMKESSGMRFRQMSGWDTDSQQKWQIVYKKPDAYSWKLGWQTLRGTQNVHTYVLAGESSTSWTQNITDFYLADNSDNGMQSIYTNQKQALQKQCNVSGWSVTKKTTSEIIYKGTLNNCRGMGVPNQYFVARLWHSKDGLHNLMYSATPSALTDNSLKQTMWKTVNNAYLRKAR